MRSLAFAARSLVRQPARTGLGVLGIAGVGALLLDMLLLSRGLVVSFRDLLDEAGFDVRVMATEASPFGGPRIPDATGVAADLRSLPGIAEAVAVGVARAEVVDGARGTPFELTAIDPHGRRQWAIAAGRDLGDAPAQPPELLLNRAAAAALGREPGDPVLVRIVCDASRDARPAVAFVVAGLVDQFPFDDEGQFGGAALRGEATAGCGAGHADAADLILVRSRDGSGPDQVAAAIRARRPDLYAVTNEEIVAQMQTRGFTYFRQISTVLSTITLLFAFLLITVLMTVSVNQRLGEIAAIRALGFSRARVAADVLWQSALLVGAGGGLAVPLGLALSVWLDRILKAMPGIPVPLHFFVFEPRALVLHGTLLAVTAVLAAVYPMWLVARLPIAATLRNEVVS
jgi:ABC-type lipoprotein release transport system permease subunit